ncbi:hypothetical protein C6H68_05970 [Photorhabdus luminescens]|nr:hypothetical protein C6H68_05970 [Photorhabdus luminescens]
MKGPAFSKQPNIPNEFQQLRDPRIGILTKQQLEKRNASGKNWHAISFNGKKNLWFGYRNARLDRRVNTGESRFSPRYSEQAKDADRLGPKGA